MKKIAFVFVAAIAASMAISFSSCKKEAPAQDTTDTTATVADTTAKDTAAQDTTAQDTTAKDTTNAAAPEAAEVPEG